MKILRKKISLVIRTAVMRFLFNFHSHMWHNVRWIAKKAKAAISESIEYVVCFQIMVLIWLTQKGLNEKFTVMHKTLFELVVIFEKQLECHLWCFPGLASFWIEPK